MNVLQIGFAESIAKRDPDKFNDPQLHQIKYGKRIFTKSFIIVKTPRSDCFQRFNLSENVEVFPTLSRNKYWFLWDAWAMGRSLIKKNLVDLIITQDPFITGLVGYLLKKEFHLPINVNDVCDFINNPYWIKEWWGNQILNPIGRWILREAESVRVDSDQEYRKLIGLGLEREKIWNLPFIVNEADQFITARPNPELRQRLLNGRFDHLVLFVGRFEDQKDLPILFNTVKRVIQRKPRALFLIIGDGKKAGELKAMANGLGIQDNLLFTGWVDYFDLPKYFANCDAFILTSRYETSPRVLIFACLCRKPIVATEVSGVTDLVEHGKNGFIVPVRDEEKLAKSVLHLLENPGEAQEMGEIGFKKVKELLDEERILSNYQRMYEFTLERWRL